ncbi:MAG: GGDEF domain-containing protein [Ruminococcus sp.]|nr:GGDEF domain-containing protein [Ruminococcus sp.]
MLFDKRIIALCTSRIYDAGLHRFIRILNDNISRFGYRLFIYTMNTDLYWNEENLCAETQVYDMLPFDRLDGVIIMDEKIKSRTICERIINRSKKAGVPVISVDGMHEGVLSVHFDYEKGFESIVRHVIEHHKVKRPHFMAGIKGNVFSDTRQAIFKKVIEENGFVYDEATMVSYGNFWAKPSRAAAQELVGRDVLPDAVICANDVMAINVCDVFQSCGIKVPDDVIITGFDGIDEAQYNIPKLATVSTNWGDLADALSKAVFDYIGDGIKQQELSVLPRLIPNESCGCAAQKETSDTYLSKLNDSFYQYQDDIRGLYNISVQMQMSTSPGQAVGFMYDYLLHDMCCVVKKEIFDREHNFVREELPEKGMVLIYDSYHSKEPIKDFDTYDIAPDLEGKLEDRHPLIFNALDYMSKCMGYICYSYKNYDITDYTKTAQINNTVSMGLGGYVNMQYQLYLADKVEQIYKNDKLTGLYTRAGYIKFYEQLIDKTPSGTDMTVIMSDLNNLKAINDTYGHGAGDIAISAVAEALKDNCPKGSLCIRYGGDEMVAIIAGHVDVGDIIERIDRQLDVFNEHSGLKFKVTTSCGAFTEEFGDRFDLEYAVKQADKIMYEVKKEKKRSAVDFL